MTYPEELTDVSRRMDFVMLFDVTDSNPNGDPDAGNLPRVDPETMQGLVTDVCLKRKVRNYIDAAADNKQGMDIYVKHRGILADEQKKAYEAINAEPGKKVNKDARAWMCENYYDIRAFGAVMTVGQAPKGESGKNVFWNCGQVRGPLQLTFARSADPVTPIDVSITRTALTNWDDTAPEDMPHEEGDEASSGQMGRKSIIPYGLYRAHGFFNPKLAEDTGFNSDDLSVFWDALQQMWDIDRSASRGLMACRGLKVFVHESTLGNAPAHSLFDRVQVRRKDTDRPAREFSDYEITVEKENLHQNITLHEIL